MPQQRISFGIKSEYGPGEINTRTFLLWTLVKRS